MAKRLSREHEAAQVPPAEIGSEVCRLCGGAVVPETGSLVDPPTRLLHRRICRRCGTEYGTAGPAMRLF